MSLWQSLIGIVTQLFRSQQQQPASESDITSMEESSPISVLVEDTLALIFSYLPLPEIRNASMVCKKWAETSRSEELWENAVAQHFGGEKRLVKCESFKQLYKSIRNSRFSVFDLHIVHFDANAATDGPYWRERELGSSPFGRVASLNSVCWLEIGGGRVVPPGTYEVLCFLQMPSQSSTNFDAKWTISARNDKGEEVSQYSWQHEKNEEMFVQMRGKGWFLFHIGAIAITEAAPTLHVHILGGNSYWFGDLEIDWFALLPTVPGKQDNTTHVEDYVGFPAIPPTEASRPSWWPSE